MKGEFEAQRLFGQVRHTLRERGLLASGRRLLLGLSGGPDSAGMLLALSHLSQEFGLDLAAASVDHGLREDAHRDVAMAAAQAQALGVPFATLSVDVGHGPSVQARARALRYQALAAEATRIGAASIAVGHTQDDQAETVLSRVLRGSGLRGLAAITPARPDGVVRPLIDCARTDVHALARARFGDDLAHDPSNGDPRYERVRLRTEVMPRLMSEDAQVHSHLANLADEAREAVALLDRLADQVRERAQRGALQLLISELESAPPALLPVLFRGWIEEATGQSVSRAHLRQLQAALGGRGEVWLTDGWAVHAEGGFLRLERRLTAGAGPLRR